MQSRLLFLIVLFFGCLADQSIEDGRVECMGKVSQGLLSLNADGLGEVVFEYSYLIGAKDSLGIEAFEWTYQLIDVDSKDILGTESQVMRDAEIDQTLIYVQGEKPRRFEVDITTQAQPGPFVLWVIVSYRGERITETFVELVPGRRYVDEAPLDKLTMFAQGG